jgi:hypothetical protein
MQNGGMATFLGATFVPLGAIMPAVPKDTEVHRMMNRTNGAKMPENPGRRA